ncbi:MAG: hypothetical protein WC752_01445 [Patescibacteria group bacterium]|jgi:hypothetical protein
MVTAFNTVFCTLLFGGAGAVIGAELGATSGDAMIGRIIGVVLGAGLGLALALLGEILDKPNKEKPGPVHKNR